MVDMDGAQILRMIRHSKRTARVVDVYRDDGEKRKLLPTVATYELSFFSYVLFIAANYYPKAYLMYPSKTFFHYFDQWFFQSQLLHSSAFLLLLCGHRNVVI